MTHNYYILIEPEPDESAFNVIVPSLPGCFTWGETHEEALANAQEAIAGHVAALVETGQPVPPEDIRPFNQVVRWLAERPDALSKTA